MAHGNDGGGSIRIPASCCGLFGLKPTRGRNAVGRLTGDLFSGLVAEHALTRSVRDSAALLEATTGSALGDQHTVPPPARPFLREVGTDPGRLRIAVTLEAANGAPVHPDCRQAVRQAAELCARLGHEVVEDAPRYDAATLEEAWFMLWADGNAQLAELCASRVGRQPVPEEFEPLTWALQEVGRSRSAADHLRSLEQLQAGGLALVRFFEGYDAWLTPTLAQPPVALGSLEPPPDDPLAWLDIDARFAPFTSIANAAGHPAMSVPLFWSAEGLPIGSHFVGRFGDEATLFRLGAQLEEAQPWTARRPPLFASRDAGRSDI
jgi:amidase